MALDLHLMNFLVQASTNVGLDSGEDRWTKWSTFRPNGSTADWPKLLTEELVVTNVAAV